MLEYGCSPIWVLDNNSLIGVRLPEGLSKYEELSLLPNSISIEYDKLFINNSVEFTYKGFSSNSYEQLFEEKVKKAIAGNQYIIEIDNNTFK